MTTVHMSPEERRIQYAKIILGIFALGSFAYLIHLLEQIDVNLYVLSSHLIGPTK